MNPERPTRWDLTICEVSAYSILYFLLRKLPARIQRLARKNYRLWKDNNADLMILPGSLPLYEGSTRNELTYSRGEIVKKLNEEAGAEVIDDIVFK